MTSNTRDKHPIYFPSKKCPLTETWKAMEQMQAKGLCRHIGVSNFSIPKLKELDRRGEKQARNEPGRNASLLATK